MMKKEALCENFSQLRELFLERRRLIRASLQEKWMSHKVRVGRRKIRLLLRKQAVVFASLFLIVGYAFIEAEKKIVILDPISVPKRLSENGFTSEVFTQRVREQLEDIQSANEVISGRDRISMAAEEDMPEIEIPSTSISLKSLVALFRNSFGREPKHLYAAITLVSEGQIMITCEVVSPGQSRYHIDSQPIDASKDNDALAFVAESLTELSYPFSLGMYFVKQNKLDAASKLADRMLYSNIYQDHQQSEVHILRSFVALGRNQTEAAIHEEEVAIGLDPSFALPHGDLGYIYMQSKEPVKALQEFLTANVLDSTDPAIYYNIATVLAQQHKTSEARDEARKEFQRAIQLDPTFAAAFSGLGNLLSDNKRWRAATTLYQTAAKLRPDDAANHASLGNAFAQLRKWEEADDQFQIALHEQPQNALIHESWGSTLLAERKTSEAVLEYKRSIGIDPKQARCHALLAIALEQTDAINEAMEEAKNAIVLDPLLAGGHRAMSQVLFKKAEYTQAYAEVNEAVKLDPDDGTVYDDRGLIELSIKHDPAEVATDFNKAIAMAPDYPYTYCHRALLSMALKEYASAEKDFKKAKQLDPLYLDPYFYEGELFRRERRFAEAVTELRRGAALAPESWNFHCALAATFYDSNDLKQFMEETHKAASLNPKGGCPSWPTTK